jgi:excinuclease ABC subunit C
MLDTATLIKNLPEKPGVYRYYAEDGMLLYIGKAKNLKKRVSSYFQLGRPHNQRLTLMISQIEKVDYTVVSSEAESLILEANLIHNLQPKYNILLKDDKNYVYVRITNEEIPGIYLVRKKFDKQSKYFGPYTKKFGISETLRTLRTIFPYCQQKTISQRPCSYFTIHQCEGICAGLESIEKYRQKIYYIQSILDGKTQVAEDYLKQKILSAIDIQNFELASLWRDRLRLLRETIVSQKIILPTTQDIDIVTLVLGLEDRGLQVGSVFVQSIRDGKMINVNNFLLSGTEDIDSGEVLNTEIVANSFLRRFMSSFYSQKSDVVDVMVQIYQTEHGEL